MTFDAIGIAGSALTVHRKWLDAISDNIANVNTASSTNGAAFQERYVIARANTTDGGVTVAGTALGNAESRLAYDPENPLADANGYVTHPVVDLSTEMTNMMLSSRLYQANLSVMSQAQQSYQAALEIGKRS